MANPEHVALVIEGARAVAEWCRAHPLERLDLSGSDLSQANLQWANLEGANLNLAKLNGAHLVGANVHMACLTEADLGGADLVGAHLVGADLRRANLAGANLGAAYLNAARLNEAWLVEANLNVADLSAANLSSANLTGASIIGTNFNQAILSGADLSQARFGFASLGDVDLSNVSGLAAVNHGKPSHIGVDTLIASFRGSGNTLGSNLTAFFRGAGVPQELLDAIPGIVADVKYFSCFVCYGQPDLEFATKLDRDLRARGVSCWTYEMDKTLGERTWREIGSRRREADKMVVLCSAAALVRPGVRKEIEEQIDEDADKLVPISLDDLWTQAGFPVVRDGRDLKPSLMERNRADFSGWKADQQGYDQALELLLKGLRRPETEQARRKRMRRSRDGGLADLI